MARQSVYLLSFFLFTLGGKYTCAQTDTTVLNEVSVVEKRSSKFAVGSETHTLDSARLRSYQGQTLTEVLQYESGIYIKAYSPGNLASTSFRGGNASQTALTWNGFNINSPLNGIFDLSLFPVSAFDEVKVQPGASSALWGSGAIGGSIHLGHRPDFRKHLTLQADVKAGSYGYHSESAILDFGSDIQSHRLMLVSQSAENNFPYINPFSGESETQINNEVSTQALLSENYFRLGSKDLLSLNLWLQQTDRNIPPSFFETTLSNQKDNISRLTSQWLHQFKRSELKIRAAWFSENQDYSILTGDTSYFNNSQTFIGEAEYSFKAGKSHTFDLGFNSTSFLADVQSYKSDPIWQHRQSLFAGYNWAIVPRLHFSTMLRQEVVDEKIVPFTYTFGLNWRALNTLTLKGQFSRVYRTPTLNDLYWNPGGNPDLEAEYGYSGEISVIWAQSANRFNWRVMISGYNRNISNWIIWQPRGGIWTPQNLLEVWSRGVESHSWLEWKSGNLSLRLNLLTNYTLSTNEKSIRPNDASVGRQLIYTPVYSYTTGLTVAFHNFSLRYNHSYTGYTYTASDHSEYLEPYHLGSIYLAYNKQWKKIGGSLFFRINNIWNEDYQVVRSHPMPGTQFNLGISLNFKFYNQK